MKRFEEMIGKKWEEVKEEMVNYVYVDADNVDRATEACIVDFTNCSFLSVTGKYREENDEVIIEVDDDAIVYDNRG
ncbi:MULTISPECIES: hypothetical protein [Fusobacterium]|uniref:Uncharacterized protein n=1 Tax=Fusobacterium equinum TaxID=134605 RepID=A0A133NBV5_9FUSO|nr:MULTISPECIES: hypothetical protein [Fusobacterium]EFS23448.1 hypothetical protein FSEG_01055 [Fusobacterium necrophorum D12]KXA13777.1 hypothetical protein HMPREF3206_01217 [Fusobacterium equinum]